MPANWRSGLLKGPLRAPTKCRLTSSRNVMTGSTFCCEQRNVNQRCPAVTWVISSWWMTCNVWTLSRSPCLRKRSIVAGLTSKPLASCTRWMMARRARRDPDVSTAESQRPACTVSAPKRDPRACKRAHSNEKCFDSSRATLVKSAKNWRGRFGCDGPNLAMISQL